MTAVAFRPEAPSPPPARRDRGAASGDAARGSACGGGRGGAAVRAIGYCVVLGIVVHVVGGVALYALDVFGGGVPLRAFARGLDEVDVYDG